MALLVVAAFVLTFAACMLGQRYGFIAPSPLWLLGSAFLVVHTYNLWVMLAPPPTSEWRVSLRSAGLVLGVGGIIYLLGWGAAFSAGFAFAGDQSLRTMGSRAGRHVLGWSIVAIVVGEVLIAHGVLPTILPRRTAYAVGLLSVLAACLLIGNLTFTTRAKERSDDNLRRSEDRFRSLVQNAADAILIMEFDTTLLYVSPAFERILGVRNPPLARFEPDLIHSDDWERTRTAYLDVVGSPGASTTMEFRMRHADGTWRWLEVDVSNHLDDPNVAGVVWNLHDITDRKGFEAQLRHHAYHDALTLIPNRVAFVERLQSSLQRVGERNRSLAVLFLDVDRFKVVNDSLSHEIGDRLLVEVAGRLQRCVRPGDLLARFGGDEFTILLDDVPGEAAVTAVADRINEAFREPITIGGREVFISASTGIAICSNGQSTVSELLRQADSAMYVAKEKGRSRWEVFDAGSAPPVAERLGLEAELWRAIENHTLAVHFQPEISLWTGKVVVVEALVRWDHPVRGFLLPNAFIPFAEESNLIVALDHYVLREACLWARHSGEHVAEPPVVSINLSPRFMHQTGAVPDIMATIRDTGLSPHRVRLEITERTALADIEKIKHSLEELRSQGILIAIDDFGTGYSSLGYLKELPVDVVKLDKSFVDGMDRLEPDAAIVQAAITMGHALGMKVTAEGVERAEQAALLRRLGCDSATGWHWSKAVPAPTMQAIVETGFPMPAPKATVRHLRPASGS